MNIVIVVDGGLVETLQATPLLRTLEAVLPDSAVTLACPPGADELVGALPGVAELLPLPGLRATAGPWEWCRAWRQLRRRRFAAALVCGSSPRSRWLVHLAGVPRRAGPAGGLTEHLLTDPMRSDQGNRAATWVRLAAVLGADELHHQPTFDPGDAAREVAAAQLLGSGVEDGRLLVAMAPGMAFLDADGAGREAMQWPPERYAHLANQLFARHGAGAILVGEGDDIDRAEAMHIDLAAPYLDLTGQLTLREIAAVLERCDLFVGGDSPVLQLAAAMRVPALGIFGPTDARRRGPYGNDQRAVQALPPAPEHHHRDAAAPPAGNVIDRIRVDDVLAWVEARATA